MVKQEVCFATITKEGIVVEIGNTVICQPKTQYSGKGVKWYEDKIKNALVRAAHSGKGK